MHLYVYLLAAYLIMSLIAFVAYGIDKRRAKRGLWRIPEMTLLGFGFFGGSVGALAAMKLFRHKTRHWYFSVVNIIGLAWQVALAVLMIVKGI